MNPGQHPPATGDSVHTRTAPPAVPGPVAGFDSNAGSTIQMIQ